MLEPLAVITNRRSTFNLRNDNWIDPLVAREADVAHFEIAHAREMKETVRRCAALGARTIVVNGGDGTAGLMFQALLNDNTYSELPALALLAGGKTNMTAAGWCFGSNARKSLVSILKLRRHGALARHLVERPILRLSRPKESTLYGAFFGAAEVVDGIKFCRNRIYPLKLPNALSHAAAMTLMFLRSLIARGSGRVKIADARGRIEDGKFFLIGITALDELLFGLRPATGSGETRHGLHYLSVRKGFKPIVDAVPDLLHGRISPGPGRTVRRIDSLTLSFDGA
ncbi:MAG: diacylglycerol kinase family protein, partial [Rhodospirillaceae bacterium]